MQHVYLSYPATEYDLAHRLVDDLQAAGYAVFVDAVSELGSIAWASETRRAIRSCGALIVLLPFGTGKWTGIRHEGVLAQRWHKPVITLVRKEKQLPRYLRETMLIDVARDYMLVIRDLLATLPDAAALRRTPSPVGRAVSPPRTLVSRRERLRQWMWGGVALLVMVSLGVLGVVCGVIPV
ncbi:MAG: TIR domain-containing protein [Chloroflexi bacterium]|nr:TIR domain-containing protein [Chloroflexota bacterium]